MKLMFDCFRIESLSSNLRDKTTHLSMQHCFHVVFYIIGTKYLHIMHPGRDKSFRTVMFQIRIKCDAHAKKSKSRFIYISAVSESMLLKQTLKTSKEKYKASFLIVVSS